MKIAIIFSPDWKEFAAISVYSIFKNNPSPVKVYMISDDNGYEDLSKLCNHFGSGYEVEYVNADPIYNKKITSDINLNESIFVKYALNRILVPHLLNEERIIILDADTIVHGNIEDFYNTNFKGNMFAAVLDIGVDQNHVKNPLGLTKDDIYINAGVSLMNLELIRDHGIHEIWAYELSKTCYIGNEQDVMNMTCKDKILLVDNKYNVSISTGLDIPDEGKKIVHFAGKKPFLGNKDVPNYHIWERYANEYKELFGK